MLRFTFGDEAETVAQLDEETSAFRKVLKNAEPSSTVIVFQVWNDSFDTYVRAANIAKKMGFHTSWLPYDADEEINIRFPQKSSDDGGITVDQ